MSLQGFTIDCAVAHSEGNCRNLPYDDYFRLGAIDAESMSFSAGPVVLPTAEGRFEVSTFTFSTDYWGRIVDWDMDLFLSEPPLNVDTDNVNGGIDSAGAPGESASVSGQPGVWGNELSKAESDFDLVVTKTVDNPTPVGPQRAVEFTVSIVNKGPGPVKDVVVVDQLPPELSIPEGMAAYTSAGYYDQGSGRWEVGDLDNSLPQVMTIPALVVAESQPACIINSASTQTEGDIYPGDNESSVAVRLPDTSGCADLIIEELFLYQYDNRCEADFSVGIQIRVRNGGPDVATNVVLDVKEPLFQAPGLKLDNAACDAMRCTWPAIEVGQSQTASGVSEHISISGISDHPHVQTLRDFRDNVLMKSAWGRKLVEFYYRYTPEIACYISERDSMRTVTRWLLTPTVFAITYPWLALVVLISLGILLYVVLTRLHKKPT